MRGKLKDPSRVRWNLKLAILRKYGTETNFARILGISKAQLSHIIVGRAPGWNLRKKVAELLGYPQEWLFKQDEE
ncbi:hypothetical protein DRP53_01450 [candidate division WOR-3 bacterium]|uniref:XRE family transcriptional regulator n=1 Tax=candidate division WOR-3 bacterium TaxID=2052148 RepID=A0A660SNB7_UNCW3|nr:MAG: hypothetical protein DRP53_01450 [candidate division WOR-3 bacterium]